VTAPIAFVLKGYPRLSETFIAQEILALERAGLDIEIVSLRHPTSNDVHPVHREISAPVRYLPEYLHVEPLRVLRGWWAARRLPGYGAARRTWLADLRRDFNANRIRRWGQALVLAAELPAAITRLHSHFIHTPASVTRYAALMRGNDWSCSAHAKDIWTSPDWELAEKLDAALWTVTCTRFGADHLSGLASDSGTVNLVYHGLDLTRFGSPAEQRPNRDGASPQAAVELLTVGRAVEKKGLDILLRALAELPDEYHWHWHHVGGGELMDRLKAQASELGIDDYIEWHGSQPQEYVLDLYRTCDAFVLPCRIADDGDRDGLPNVLVEASSQGLPCISTPISGVPELIDDGETGLLVAPEDAGALRDALMSIISEPALRRKIGRQAEAQVRKAFDHHAGIGQLLDLFSDGAPSPVRHKGAA
jgi:glycosyltransferase involved in cell wall biosynthesis